MNNLYVYDILSMFSIHYIHFSLVSPRSFHLAQPRLHSIVVAEIKKYSLYIEIELHFLVILIGLAKLLLWYINFDCIQQQQDQNARDMPTRKSENVYSSLRGNCTAGCFANTNGFV